MIKNTKYEAGSVLLMLCAACDIEQEHLIESVTKQGQITKADCKTCGTSSTFRYGVKTSVSMGKSKNAQPYDRTRKYKRGQLMLHSVFGLGEVTLVIEPQKIDVLFGDCTRRLIHEQRPT